MPDRQIAVTDRFAVVTDGIQWILQRREGRAWHGISFVRSTKAILARCMREKGVPPDEAEALLSGLPNCFDCFLEGRQPAANTLCSCPPLQPDLCPAPAADVSLKS